ALLPQRSPRRDPGAPRRRRVDLEQHGAALPLRRARLDRLPSRPGARIPGRRPQPRAPAARRRARLHARLIGRPAAPAADDPASDGCTSIDQGKEPEMNKLVTRGLWTVLATGGFMALGVGVAHADTQTDG